MTNEKIQIRFLGGAGSIGASCALVTVDGLSLLIDCGVRFSPVNPLPDLDQLSGMNLDAILVTHGHSDHTGALPLIHEAFPGTPVYMTAPTKDLVGILQRDALKLMNTADREFEIPLYSQKHVDGMLNQVITVRYGQRFTIGNVIVTFLSAGHILGASMIHLETPDGNILFTGDYSISGQTTVPHVSRSGLHVDCLVTEATYGARLHSDRKLAEKRLVRQVSEIIHSGGKVLIPAFAIGRAQEVILILKSAMRRKSMPAVPVYVDGMIRAVCDSYRRHESFVSKQLLRAIFKESHPFYTGSISPVSKPAERAQITTGDPCVIISSSGMLQGGPSAFYAVNLAENELNAILITGYQDEEAPGRLLQNLADSKDKRIQLNGQEIQVACKCETYSLSAHADRLQIAGFIESHKPRTVILVHGDHQSRSVLKDSLTCRDVVIPEDGDCIARSYPVRKSEKSRLSKKPALMTRQAAIDLLGPGTGNSISLNDLCESWFGHQPNPDEKQLMLNQLLDFKLVYCDTENSEILWPLTEVDKAPVLTKNDFQREEELKEKNPYGTLLEFVSRRKIKKPKTVVHRKRFHFLIEIQITIAGETLSSELQSGHTETMAMHAAAEVLLQRLSSMLINAGVQTIDAGQEEEYKLKNYKGQLIEKIQSIRSIKMKIQSEAVPGGFSGWGFCSSIHNDSIDIKSGMYFAKSLKTVEHAIGKELLEQINDAEKNQEFVKALMVDDSSKTDPLITLNEMKQTGELSDYGFEVTGSTGPAHAREFTMKGWFQIPGCDCEFTEEVTAASKKKCKRRVADLILLEALRY